MRKIPLVFLSSPFFANVFVRSNKKENSSKKEIILLYNDIQYMTNIAFDTRGRTPLFWNTELANKIREDFNNVFIDFCNGKTPFVIPKMKLTKYNEVETVVLILKVDK